MNLMGVPELVHSTQQHLSNAMWHPSSPHKQRHTRHCKANVGRWLVGQSPAARKHSIAVGLETVFLYLCSTFFPENLPRIDLFHEACYFYPRSRRGVKTGKFQNRTRDCWLCTFLPEHKDSANAEQVFTLNSQTTANARRETETGQGQLYFKAISSLQTEFSFMGEEPRESYAHWVTYV